MVSETKKLLALPAQQAIASERLFELYIQRQDLNMFVHDFKDSQAFFGPADASDPFDWSTFMVEDYEDVLKYKQLYKDAEDKVVAAAHLAAGTQPTISNNQKKREIIIKGEDGKRFSSHHTAQTCMDLGPCFMSPSRDINCSFYQCLYNPMSSFNFSVQFIFNHR